MIAINFSLQHFKYAQSNPLRRGGCYVRQLSRHYACTLFLNDFVTHSISFAHPATIFCICVSTHQKHTRLVSIVSTITTTSLSPLTSAANLPIKHLRHNQGVDGFV